MQRVAEGDLEVAAQGEVGLAREVEHLQRSLVVGSGLLERQRLPRLVAGPASIGNSRIRVAEPSRFTKVMGELDGAGRIEVFQRVTHLTVQARAPARGEPLVEGSAHE